VSTQPRSLGEIGQRDTQRLKQGKPATCPRQQEAFGFPEAGRGSLSTQLKNARYQPQPFRVEGHEALGVKLAEGNVQCPLFGCYVTQTVDWQVDAFSDPDPRDASQQEGIGIQVVCTAQFLLQSLIVFRRQRPGKILRTNREIFADDKAWLEAMPLGSQVVEQAAKTEQALLARMVAHRRT
jgi:hypothetical protein